MLMFYNKKLVAEKLRSWERYLLDYSLPSWNELPTFDLYMDQVIGLLIEYLDYLPHEDDYEKIVTPSAVNNYVRMKIMPAPNKKKYSRVHMAYLIMICTLKQSLNISIVRKMIPLDITEEEVRTIYSDFVQKHKAATYVFIEQIRRAAIHVLDPEDTDENPVGSFVSTVAVISGFSKLLTEKVTRLQNAGGPDAGNDAARKTTAQPTCK